MLSNLRSWREALTPVAQSSDFRASGQLTPEEFVDAGDYLVHQFPSWSWQTDASIVVRHFMPNNKQYLVCKDVPCTSRISDEVSHFSVEDDSFEADAIAITGNVVRLEHDNAEKPIDARISSQEMAAQTADGVVGSTVEFRTYDLFITYDKYYRTPRFWLYGWSEVGVPLTVDEVFQDVSADHVGKTVTMEPFPHSAAATPMATVHPCKHAAVMKTFITRASGKDQVRVDQYLVIFLKFITTITPSIEHETGTFTI
ncbi:E2-like enzyme [Savitreella phatthalungensis]